MPLGVTRHAEEPSGWARLAREVGTFYHDPRWIREIAATFRYRVHWLSAGAEGGLALAEVPALVGRGRLVSFPFSYIAGPLARTGEIAAALGTAAQDLAAERGLRRIEIKQLGTTAPPPQGFARSTRYTTYRVPTTGGEQAVWKRLHVTSTQQRIRKGQKAGVIVLNGRGTDDWLAMARLEERVQHAFGVPAPPRHFFLGACRRLQDAGLADLYLARVPDGRVAAGFVMFKGPREWVYAFSASDLRFVREYRPTHVLLWEGLRRAAAAGVVVDLGRTAPEQASLAEFKLRWGAEPVPLAYDYWPDAGGLQQARRDRGVLALAARLWSWLPAPVARLGSGLYRYLG
jgi:Acetyltransferase (GNAT) domain